ncbi:MAG: amidohydrolase family protein [Endomicrobiaceae bacterium]|nr:amidohydrolase family protein [Endomicrobiaceae bacterium]
MKIIDSHTHVWPDKVAQKAKDYLEKVFRRPMTALPTVDGLLKTMDENEISKSIIASVASRPDQVKSINNWLFSLKSDRFLPFASLHPFYKDWSNELDRIKDNSFGIKFQPEFQDFYIDDEKIFPIYEKMEKLGIPMLVHCGYELSLTGLVHAGPDQILKVLKTFPSIKFIGAHMGGFKMWDEIENELIGKDIYIDTSSSISFMKKEQIYRFFKKHDINKIFFGSDFPVGNQKYEIEFLKSLDIEKDNLKKILHSNITKFLNI